jgi:aspartate aminotransferase-like enzyme
MLWSMVPGCSAGLAVGSGCLAEKRYLMTPGPTPVPPEVLAAMALPIVHHRGPDFKPIYKQCLERLQEVFRTRGDVLLYTASGTAGLESVVSNLTSPGDRVVVVSAGYFGERWADIAAVYGCDVAHIRYEWGETPAADDLSAQLAELGGAKAVLVTQSETSTGVVSDVRAFAAAAKEAGTLIGVDAISSLGAIPCETDAWSLDSVVSGSQKALMAPPGLAMVSVSGAAWEASKEATAPRFYVDWERTRAGQENLDAPFTPAVSIVVGLNIALGLILGRGLEAAFEHHVRLGRACREGIKAMGLELFSPDDDTSAVVTTVRIPEPVDGTQFLLDLRDRMGITLAPGQGPIKGKVFRIGHIGFFDVFDITTALAGIELALAEAGADIERGVAVTRALETYEHLPA